MKHSLPHGGRGKEKLYRGENLLAPQTDNYVGFFDVENTTIYSSVFAYLLIFSKPFVRTKGLRGLGIPCVVTNHYV